MKTRLNAGGQANTCKVERNGYVYEPSGDDNGVEKAADGWVMPRNCLDVGITIWTMANTA